MSFHHTQKTGKKFEQNNKTITLNIFYVPHNTKQIREGYISEYNEERDNQVKLLMITDGKTNWNKILKYNQGEKSLEVPFIIYAMLT